MVLDDDKALGAIIRDRIDNDFGWVVLIDGADEDLDGLACVNANVSYPIAAEAKRRLFEAMIEQHKSTA